MIQSSLDTALLLSLVLLPRCYIRKTHITITTDNLRHGNSTAGASACCNIDTHSDPMVYARLTPPGRELLSAIWVYRPNMAGLSLS